jgi:DHHC palmitoyltransferase
MAPPPLESVTRGGLGPAGTRMRVRLDDDDNNNDKSKEMSATRRWWNAVGDVCRPCCAPPPTPQSPHDHPNLYYEDHFNDMSWSCSFGTADENGVWLNQSDFAGCIMSCMVWVLILYSALTMTLLAETNGIPPHWAMLYSLLAALALSSHVKTTLTDPGSVPASAVPTEAQRLGHAKLSMCSQCQSFKPPLSHHCRICNRCISRMDHHCTCGARESPGTFVAGRDDAADVGGSPSVVCLSFAKLGPGPWMNNCVGLGNLKHFLLFLIYTWSCSVFCLTLLGWNYFFCANEACTFNTVLTQLVRIMTVLSVGAFLFVREKSEGRNKRHDSS